MLADQHRRGKQDRVRGDRQRCDDQ